MKEQKAAVLRRLARRSLKEGATPTQAADLVRMSKGSTGHQVRANFVVLNFSFISFFWLQDESGLFSVFMVMLIAMLGNQCVPVTIYLSRE